MYKVLQPFNDAFTLELLTEGTIIDWDDPIRIQSAVKRGLIEEVKAEPKKKAAPKKAAKKKQ